MRKSKKHKKKKVKKETDDEGEGEGGESETEIEPQNPAEPQIPPESQIPKEPQIPTEPQKPAEEIPALSVKLTKTKYENVGILQNPKKGKKPPKGDKHNPGLMTRYNNLLISGDEAEDGKELPSQLKRFVKPSLPKIEDQSSPLPLPSPVKMLSPAERMPRSLQLDKTQDQSKIITGIENEIVTGIPRSETQKAERIPKKNKLDKTQDHRYNKENSPPMSLSTTQELPPVKATLQKTQTYFDVTQQDDGTTQKSLSKLSTAIEDEVFVTGLQRTETQESESTQTLAKVASLTPIETTQCSTLGETQLTTKATQQTQSAAPPSHKSVTEEPLKTATERDQLDKPGENQNNPPILISTKQAKKDASIKIKKVDEAEKKKLNVEAEREAKKAAEGERLRKLRENAPKPKVLKRNSWEEKVAGGKVFRRKHEYPTNPKIVFPNVTPKAGSSSSSTSPN
uniref:Uncharacterized protein n=1 Tax=Panagrolaimus davidi TaxID=227884 RepID=A0A914NY06_9BILA